MSKYITTAFKQMSTSPGKDEEVLIDLKEVTEQNPMIGACERDGVEGVVLMVKTRKNLSYAYFVLLATFVDFIAWDMGFELE
jgi:hypothetical protein